MRRRILTCVCAWTIAIAIVNATDFWETKPFLDWSDKEVEKLLNDSPWAAIIAVPLPNTGPVPSIESSGGGRGGGEGRGESFGPGPRRVKITISWRSAIPLKQAVVRQQAGQHGTVSPDAQAILAKEDEYYVVGIQGLPPQLTMAGTGKTIDAFLRRDGKPAIPAQQAGVQMMRGGSLLMIGFPRTDPITVDDGDVELDVKLGDLHIKKKFKLKELVFAGKLAL